MPVIQRREWLWAAAWATIILIITSLPYLYGAAISTPSNRFGGFVMGVEDGNSYLAKMQEGRAGNWLFYLAYTPEPHRGALFFLYYLLLGKLSGLLKMAPLLVLHLSRIFTIPFGLLSFYYFVAYFTSNIEIRRAAFLLFSLTAGLGWLWILLGWPIVLGAMPVDLWVPDASFFLSAFTFPHLPLAQGLLLWVVVGCLRFLENGQFSGWVIAAGAGFLVSFIHPYTLPVLATVLGLYLLVQVYRQDWLMWPSIRRLILILLPAIPYLIYVFVVFETNFAFKTWREQSLTLSPNPIYYLLGFGLILPLVGLGIWQTRQINIKHAAFLNIWVLAVPLLVYFPIALQRRFLDGYQSPLALLGGVGLVWLINRVKFKKQRFLILTIVFILMSLTNLVLIIGGMTVVNGRQEPIFHAGTQHAAFRWLSDRAQDQVVLAARQTGNVLPAYAPVRVFVGHGPETVQAEVKQAQVHQFFTAKNDGFRRQLQRDYNLAYLLYGPAEQTLGDFLPKDAPYLHQVYDNGEVQIYRFVDITDN